MAPEAARPHQSPLPDVELRRMTVPRRDGGVGGDLLLRSVVEGEPRPPAVSDGFHRDVDRGTLLVTLDAVPAADEAFVGSSVEGNVGHGGLRPKEDERGNVPRRV